MRMIVAAAIGLSLVAASTASAQRPERAVEQPVIRSMNWFGYVGGDDIRAACVPAGRNRIRLIYNGLWDTQVRTYEVFLQPDGTAGLNVGVLADQGDVAQLLLSSPSDITGPWRMKKGERLLDVAETRELIGLLEASAAFGPPRDGMKLPENDFWWTVASCRNGVWGFQAYHYPTDGFANVRFAEKLWSWDSVKVSINRPRKLVPAELRRDPLAPRGHLEQGPRWMLVVGNDGLRPR